MTDTETILQELRLLRKQVEKLTATMLPSEEGQTIDELIAETEGMDTEELVRFFDAKFKK